MYSYINAGDLNDMREFDLSSLNGLLSVCSDITISQMGIHMWLGSKRVSILGNKIDFTFLGRTFKFDDILISFDNIGDLCVLEFTIRYGDSEIYLSVVSDM